MEMRKTLAEVIEGSVVVMEKLNYSLRTIELFRAECRKFVNYVQQTSGSEFFTEEIGTKYLNDKFDYPSIQKNGALPYKVKSAVRCVRKLGEFNLHDAFVYPRKSQTNPKNDWIDQDMDVILAYLDAAQTADNKESTKKIRRRHIEMFYRFLRFRDIDKITDITAHTISEYAMSLQGASLVSIKHNLATLRNFFRFLYENGYCSMDWSHSVPRLHAPTNLNVPALWEKSEIELLLKSVDRRSPVGKRDYAILMLVAQLGIRVSDIADLRLNNLKWDRKEIEFVQIKTSKNSVYPLLDDTGWAIIDYIRYARPQSDSDIVFLTCNAPYTKLQISSISAILNRQMKRCGVKKKAGTVSGMHSLRHALARRLLEQGTSLDNVANIMVHTDHNSTFPYLKVDIEGLRNCGLSLEGVLGND